MRLRQFLVGVFVMVCGATQAQMPDMTIPVDTAVRIGKLDNGLTYYIRHNNWPEHRANFYIAQKVGSLEENESQRGLAHFLEHMAFNGSDNFKGNGLIEWCRSKGIEFGGDLNAYTAIDQTVYNINNVPTNSVATLDSCLLILRDWSTGLTLDPKEIDKERGVIHEEWRLRTSASSRMFERNLPALYPGSKYGLRYPIGLMSVIDNFKHQELVDYYHTWYHPDHQGIIVVGDIDVDRTEAQIKKLFGSIKNPENELPLVDEPVPDNDTAIVIVDKDKEQESSVISVMMKHDVFPDSLKQMLPYLINDYAKSAAVSMLNDRYQEAVQKAGCPYVVAQVSDGQYIYAKTKDAFGLDVVPKDMSQSSAALKAAYTELRRAVEFGFTPTEYKRFQDNYLSQLEKQYSNRDKRTNQQFYSQCVGHFLTNEPMPSIDFTYMVMNQVAPNIPVDLINQVLPELVTKSDTNLVVISFNNEKEGNVYPTPEGLLQAIHEARAEQISAYVDNVKNEPIMSEKPKAGKIVKEEKNDKFGYTTLTLSNGVKVVLKKTDYKKDQVIMQGFGDGGSALYGQKDYANIQAFDDVVDKSSLGSFTSTELQKALAGKIAGATLTMGERHMMVNGSSTPKDVETMLQLTYLYFTQLHKDTAAFHNIIEGYKVDLKNRELNPDIAFADSVTTALYGNDWRRAPMKLKDITAIDNDRIIEMAKEMTATAKGWTFEIIGNFDNDSIRPLICQYLGALPAKGKVKKATRMSKITTANVNNTFYRKMETPKANAYFFWLDQKTPYSLEQNIQASMAGQILSMVYLKEIREEASAAYSCGAYGAAALSDDGWHVVQLVGVCPMKPEKKDVALKIMDDAAKNLAVKCDAEMLDKVKTLMLKQHDTALKTNGYWLGTIDSYITTGVDNHTDYVKTINAQTPETISAFMKNFLANGNTVKVVMLPEAQK